MRAKQSAGCSYSGLRLAPMGLAAVQKLLAAMLLRNALFAETQRRAAITQLLVKLADAFGVDVGGYTKVQFRQSFDAAPRFISLDEANGCLPAAMGGIDIDADVTGVLLVRKEILGQSREKKTDDLAVGFLGHKRKPVLIGVALLQHQIELAFKKAKVPIPALLVHGFRHDEKTVAVPRIGVA